MKYKIKKRIINILLGIIPVSKLRKKIRQLLLMKIFNNSLTTINSNGKIARTHLINGLDIEFNGKNSSVIIHRPISFKNCKLDVGSNTTIEIFQSKHKIVKLRINTTNNSKILIGNNFSCFGCTIENHDEKNLEVCIGEDCMFSEKIKIRVSDGHTIYNQTDKSIINKPHKGIYIGNHVWIGMCSTILKDVTIPNNTVIGANSLVNKIFEKENTIIAGIPAKIIKENINWDRKHTDNFCI